MARTLMIPGLISPGTRAVLCLALSLAWGIGLSGPAQAQVVGTLHDFRHLGQSSRAMGMGGAYTALAQGPESFFYNPAGLALAHTWQIDLVGGNDTSDFSYSFYSKTLNGFRGLAGSFNGYMNAQPQAREPRGYDDFTAASWHNGKGLGLALFSIHSEHTAGFLDTSMTNYLVTANQQTSGAVLTYAWATSDETFVLGGSIKGYSGTAGMLTDSDASLTSTMGYQPHLNNKSIADTTFDLGMRLQLGIPFLKPTLGAALLNGGAKKPISASGITTGAYYGYGTRETFNVGVALGPMKITDLIQVSAAFENEDVWNQHPFLSGKDKLHQGVEFALYPINQGQHGLYVRFGTAFGRPTQGVSLQLAKNVLLNYAAYSSAVVVENTNLTGLSGSTRYVEQRQYGQIIVEF
ncbi:MAG: hypothetical protein OEV94_00975 [Deltaproteobacteria bacterium]|nr:hypothetical protein [Deltaproteobacteria bacterium]